MLRAVASPGLCNSRRKVSETCFGDLKIGTHLVWLLWTPRLPFLAFWPSRRLQRRDFSASERLPSRASASLAAFSCTAQGGSQAGVGTRDGHKGQKEHRMSAKVTTRLQAGAICIRTALLGQGEAWRPLLTDTFRSFASVCSTTKQRFSLQVAPTRSPDTRLLTRGSRCSFGGRGKDVRRCN